MKQPRWLLEQTIIAVHSMVLEEHGGAPGIRDEDMLASALNRPVDKYNYEPDCTIFELAALFGGVFVAVAYWVVHHSGLSDNKIIKKNIYQE